MQQVCICGADCKQCEECDEVLCECYCEFVDQEDEDDEEYYF